MPNCSWEDIGGLENVKRELQEVIKVYYVMCIHSFILLQLTILISVLYCHADCSIPGGAS